MRHAIEVSWSRIALSIRRGFRRYYRTRSAVITGKRRGAPKEARDACRGEAPAAGSDCASVATHRVMRVMHPLEWTLHPAETRVVSLVHRNKVLCAWSSDIG